MKLSYVQRREILDQGYTVVRGAVPRLMVDEALRLINHSVGEGMDPAQIQVFRSQSYCPELRNSPVIQGLAMQTPVFELAESVTGAGKLKPVGGGQIALRFPRLDDAPPPPKCHLDGMSSPNNGVAPGTLGNYTMLAVVLLSELKGPYAGNFTVWPGTHRLYEAYFREHGPESLLNGMPPVDLPEPVQLTGSPGDVVLTHYQVAHGVTPNLSPHIRYAVIFRLNHADRTSGWNREAMTDLWLEWPGIRELLEQPGTAATSSTY